MGVLATIARGVDPMQMANQVMQYRTAQQQLATQQFNLQQAQLQPAYAGLMALRDKPDANWGDVQHALAQSQRLGADISGLTANANEMMAQGGSPTDYIRRTSLRGMPAWEQFGVVGLTAEQLAQHFDFVDRNTGETVHTSLGDAINRGLYNPGIGAGGGAAGGGYGTPAGPAAAAPGVRPPLGEGLEKPAAAADLAALPDVQSLPQGVQSHVVNAMANAGLGPLAAGHYARMLRQESQGQQIDPTTGKTIASKAGALGIAQVMPQTFADMQKRYGITGDINDLDANLNAGARYYREGLDLTNGDATGAAVYYNAGPGGLITYRQGGQLPAETRGYITATRPPGAPYQVAGPAVPPSGAAAPPQVAAPAPNQFGQTGGVIRSLPPGTEETWKTSVGQFNADRNSAFNLQQRTTNLTQALNQINAHPDLQFGPHMEEAQNLQGFLSGVLGRSISPADLDNLSAFQEINKELRRYVENIPGSERSDLAAINSKISNPSVEQQREALKDLIARTVGLERMRAAGYMNFASKYGASAPGAAIHYLDEMTPYVQHLDPVAFAYDVMDPGERRQYYDSLSAAGKADYQNSIEEASRLYRLPLPGSAQ